MCICCASALTCAFTPVNTAAAVLWGGEVRGLKKPLKCYELYWSEIPECIDYKPYETRRAEDLKLDRSAISMGGILSSYFWPAFESLLFENAIVSAEVQCCYSSRAISAEGEIAGVQFALYFVVVLLCIYLHSALDHSQTNCTLFFFSPYMFLRMFLSTFLSPELHVFSGLEVFDQPVYSHTAGPHHCLPCTGSPGKNTPCATTDPPACEHTSRLTLHMLVPFKCPLSLTDICRGGSMQLSCRVRRTCWEV